MRGLYLGVRRSFATGLGFLLLGIDVFYTNPVPVAKLSEISILDNLTTGG